VGGRPSGKVVGLSPRVGVIGYDGAIQENASYSPPDSAAVADACGWHCPDFPLTAERLLMALSRNPGPENPAEQFKEGGQ
jgi:hypothetical protein